MSFLRSHVAVVCPERYWQCCDYNFFITRDGPEYPESPCEISTQSVKPFVCPSAPKLFSAAVYEAGWRGAKAISWKYVITLLRGPGGRKTRCSAMQNQYKKRNFMKSRTPRTSCLCPSNNKELPNYVN